MGRSGHVLYYLSLSAPQLIDQKIRMCQQLIGSQTFVCVLEYLLAVGNYLNEHAGKDKAKGFRLSSLTKVSFFLSLFLSLSLTHTIAHSLSLPSLSLSCFPFVFV